MLVRVLGPIGAESPEGNRAIGGPRQRRLLALLASARGDVVSVDRLVDRLWDEDERPSHAYPAVRSYVARLRRALGGADTIVTEPPGYHLSLGDGIDIDAERFESLVETATLDSDLEMKVKQLKAALALWRGSAYAEFAHLDWAHEEGRRLERLRAIATESLLEAQLSSDSAAALIPAITREVDGSPFNERLRILLAQALWLAGETVEALRVCHNYRRMLATETGLEPGTALIELEAEILGGTSPADAARGATAIRAEHAERVGLRPGGNLPAQTTSFIGREAELVELVELIQRTRLLTVTGPGGAGKTRLAFELARRVSDRFPGGAWFVDLSPIENPDEVVRAICAVFSVEPGDQGRLTESLTTSLSLAPTLLVLDTCERLVDPVAELVDQLLASVETLTVLATSREILRLPSEAARSVGSLGSDAVRLFCERASATTAAFELSDDNRTAAEAICEQLDGMPLAIELAAAKTVIMGPTELAAQLRGSTEILSTEGRGRPDRHVTLDDAIAWSYRLLDDVDRELFECLCVFTSSFNIDGATGLCAASPLDRHGIIDGVERLVNKSMISRHGPSTAFRFRLLDTLRSFGLHQLEERGTLTWWRDAHLHHFDQWLATSVARTDGADGISVRQSILAETNNVRGALDYALEVDDLDRAIPLIANATRVLSEVGRYDLYQSAARMLDHPQLEGHSCALEGYVGLTLCLAIGLGEDSLCRRAVDRGLAIDPTMPLLVSMRGVATTYGGDPVGGHPDCERAWHLAVASGDPAMMLRVATPSVYSLSLVGRTEAAYERWQEALNIAVEPVQHYLQAFVRTAGVTFSKSHPETAHRALTEALSISDEMGFGSIASRARIHLARLALDHGRPNEALARAVDVVSDDFRAGARTNTISWLHRVAVIMSCLGRYEDALTVHAAVPPVAIWPGDDPKPHLAAARTELGAARYRAALRRGRAMSVPEVVAWLREV